MPCFLWPNSISRHWKAAESSIFSAREPTARKNWTRLVAARGQWYHPSIAPGLLCGCAPVAPVQTHSQPFVPLSYGWVFSCYLSLIICLLRPHRQSYGVQGPKDSIRTVSRSPEPLFTDSQYLTFFLLPVQTTNPYSLWQPFWTLVEDWRTC